MNAALPKINFVPSAPPPPGDGRLWMDHLAACAISCAKTIESRRIKANEAPIVLGALCLAMSDHAGIPLETALHMVGRSARGLMQSAPENHPSEELQPGPVS